MTLNEAAAHLFMYVGSSVRHALDYHRTYSDPKASLFCRQKIPSIMEPNTTYAEHLWACLSFTATLFTDCLIEAVTNFDD